MRIRVLHTSDWHLGKRLFKVSRHEEQRLFLDGLLETLTKERIDALLISGDIFDSPNPPVESIKLFYDFLAEASKDHRHIYIIAGNHDSGKFLTVPTALLTDQNIFIAGEIKEAPDTLYFQKENLLLQFDLIPYFRSSLIGTADDPLVKIREYLEKGTVPSQANYKVALIHHQVGSFEFSGSEYGLSLSGIDSIPTSLFSDYDYLALGHIHKKMVVSKERPLAIYPGAPIPMRFSEQNEKFMVLLEFTKEKMEPRYIAIPSNRNILSIAGTTETIEEKIKEALSRPSLLTPLVEVKITNPNHLTGLADKMRALVALCGAELVSFQIENHQKNSKHQEVSLKDPAKSLEELFAEYYQERFKESLNPQILSLFREILSESITHENQPH